MGKRDGRVDDYIAESAEFARPILAEIRGLVHQACPEVRETMKWSFPHFEYRGILCSMAAFKHHCSFGFWNQHAMKDPDKILFETGEYGMGHLGKLRSLEDLPARKILLAYIRQAARLHDEGVKARPRKPKAKSALEVPDYLLTALRRNKNALTTFESFSPSNKRDYVEWVVEAKTDETRERRLATAIEWMAEGKIRNWKYVKC